MYFPGPRVIISERNSHLHGFELGDTGTIVVDAYNVSLGQEPTTKVTLLLFILLLLLLLLLQCLLLHLLLHLALLLRLLFSRLSLY